MSDPKDSGKLRGGGGDVAAQKVLSVVADIQSQGYSRMQPFGIGKIEHRMEYYAESHNMNIPDEIYMEPGQIAHALRDEKVVAGIAVDPTDLAQFAKNRTMMDLYYDTSAKTFLYTDGKNKYILHPSRDVKIARKHHKKVNFITASKLGAHESFSQNRRFDKIE